TNPRPASSTASSTADKTVPELGVMKMLTTVPFTVTCPCRLTNVRDFPVPMRHRGVRIELRNRSFRKGKSHERSFYAWNRLGKEYVLRTWNRRGRSGDGAAYGLAQQARRARGATAAVPDRHGGVLRRP